MFAEWTDPYDIDHYYNDVGKVYRKVNTYVNPEIDAEREREVAYQTKITNARNYISKQVTDNQESFGESTQGGQLAATSINPTDVLPDGHPMKIPMVYHPVPNEHQIDFALRSDKRDSFLQQSARLAQVDHQDQLRVTVIPKTITVDLDTTCILLLIIIGIMFMQILRLYSSLETMRNQIQALRFDILASTKTIN